jgi:hypothetical protein
MTSSSRSRARFILVALLGAVGLGGCANRGMQARTDGPRDHAMEGPLPEAGDAGLEVEADADADAGAQLSEGGGETFDDRAQLCASRFNFENGALYGAMDNNDCPVCLKAFLGIASSGVKTVCGAGALEITAAFSGTTGRTTGGEILLPLNTTGRPEDLSGKTITVNVTAAPPGNVSFVLLLSTSGGYENVPGFPLSLTQSQWSSASYRFPSSEGGIPEGGVPYMRSVYALSLEAFSDTGYTGKIYVDEIDIR